MESKDELESEYKLSIELLDEPLESLRCVVVDSDDLLITGSINGVFRAWRRTDTFNNLWDCQMLFNGIRLHGEKNALFALARLPGGQFASGGSDDLVQIWSLEGDILESLAAHKNHVNSLTIGDHGILVSGSFDGSAIVWQNSRILHHLKGHPYGVETLVLTNGDVVTASGDQRSGHIKIWRNGNFVRSIEGAHSSIIRRLKPHPLGFVSCANDGFVKIWSSEGELITSIQAHRQLANTDPFVYGVIAMPNGDVISIGEDCNARIFSQDGTPLQAIRHPAPIRDIAAFENGDFVTASGDGVARIWTKVKHRVADPSKLAAYQEYVDLASSSNIESIDRSQCHPESILSLPGKRPGQVVVVDVRGRGPTVYQWDGNDNKWVLVGDALGQREKKPTFDGKEYDHVVYIDLGPSFGQIPLAFNRDGILSA